MRFDEWEPVYRDILTDFGFERSADERARDVLAGLTVPFEESRLGFSGQRVAIAGAAPCLADETDLAGDADSVVAASTAVDTLAAAGVATDVMVTDLDKNPETARELTHASVPVAVHAHGDNVPTVEAWVPRFDAEWVIPTTQAAPVGPVVNYGGFTDGDRAAFLADHFGAGELVFVGWDFDDPAVDPVKAKKLAWAERLLRLLETRRGERFSVLDGRR